MITPDERLFSMATDWKTLRSELPSDVQVRLNVKREDRDIASAEKVKADIAMGLDEMIPEDVVRQLVNGENRVKVWRDYRNITARELATLAGISAPYLSEIETGKKDGTLATMKKIADALRIDLDDLA
jgi:DNA-binding XRE family transcriptional regulator